MALACGHLCSIGFKSGEDGGRYSSLCPAFSMAAFVSARLWKAALSMTMTAASGSLGIRSCRVQAWNTSLSLLQENSVTVGRVDQRADDSGAPFGIPVLFPETAFAARAVAMGARHVVCKAAFVNINNGLSRLTPRLDPIPEAVPSVGAARR